MIHPKKVGHVVLKARDLDPIEKFYTEVLGFQVVMRLKQPRGVFFTLGEQHHDLACWKCPQDPTIPRWIKLACTILRYRSKTSRRLKIATGP